MISLDTHIWVVNDGIDHRLPLQAANLLHPLFLNLIYGLRALEIIHHDFYKWTCEEVCEQEGEDVLLPKNSTVDDIIQTYSEHLVHQLFLALLLESFFGGNVHLRYSLLRGLLSLSSFNFLSHQTHLFFIVKHDIVVFRNVVRVYFRKEDFIFLLDFDLAKTDLCQVIIIGYL